MEINFIMIIISLFMACMPIPHIKRMIKTKSSQDQSLFGVCGVAVGIISWIIYGIFISSLTLVIGNIIMLSTYLAYLGTVIYFRVKNRKESV